MKTRSTVGKAALQGAGSSRSGIPAAARVAAVQMASGPRVEGNLREAGRLIERAVEQGAQLVALPEHFAILGMREEDKVALREMEGNGPIQAFLSGTARKHGIWLVGGSVPLECRAPDKVRNSSLVYDATGRLVARYDKIHLFGFEMGEERYSEERTIEPGDRIVVIDSPFGRIGLSVCYDLRFPELYRAMKGVEIILVPSAFTETTGRAHWEPLIRARAIENLAYVVAPAQGGYHVNGRETHGDSMIVDPWGVVLDRLHRGSGVVVARIDLLHLQRLRQSLPALKHRTLGRSPDEAQSPAAKVQDRLEVT
ncbi:MAG TPA: carbon-nitrogen hydrolase family protein [Burkholderiales bacterium]|jgi:nitrilase|nr:carbon-nitrogen hydrolase family protein [Burkholderiales bacterium]